jgi:hypothetical protein
VFASQVSYPLDRSCSKVSYPPDISCSQSITLIDGARPVHITSYRYAPVLKTEIENQVQDMLKQGLI